MSIQERKIGRLRRAWARARPKLATWLDRVGRILSGYFDDLLLVSAVACFTAAAGEAFGRPAALATAGAGLLVYSIIVARSRRGGGR